VRLIPNINIEGQAGYAKLLGHNFDSVQECYDLFMPIKVADRLDIAQKAANEKFDGEQAETIQFGGENFQIWCGGATGGIKWVIENDDFQLFFNSPITKYGEVKKWGVGVRYKSAGLWEYGIIFLKQRVMAVLFQEGFSLLNGDNEINDNVEFIKSWQRVNRVDYAFDFYSEKFSFEMKNQRLVENLILPSGVKYMTVGTSTTTETLTAGMNRKGAQIQIYDKGKEITEASGKIWMFKVWEKNGFIKPEDGKAKNVWRLEIRFGKGFIQDRGALCFEEFNGKLQNKLCEAIFKRRLAVPDGRKHREDWDLHPIFAEAYRATDMAGKYAPIGRQQTQKAEELYLMLGKQIKGIGRSMDVLKNGEYHDESAKTNLIKLSGEISSDKKHKNKEEKAQERYKLISEAK